MQPNDVGVHRAQGQTIVIERAERRGCFRSALRGVGYLIVAGVVLFLLVGRDSNILPTHLSEKYVAGDITPTADKVAIVEVEGMIFSDTVDHALKQLRQARDDSHVKAVVLRVDSPGGTVSGSDRIWREVEVLKLKGKPVVASMGGMAASGGYYVSAGADTIIAEPTTFTGSIGVITEFPHVQGLLEKVGVEVDTLTTGPWKDSPSYFRSMSEAERKRWHEVLNHSYERFVRVVAQGRKLPLADVKAAADGRVYTADEAVKLKLVNRIGYLDDAINEAKSRASLTAARVIRYAKPISFSDVMGGLSSAPKRGFQLDQETLLRLEAPQVLLMAR
jgi:signal peptide peptidase SppA